MRKGLRYRRADQPTADAFAGPDIDAQFAVRTRPGRCPTCAHEPGPVSRRTLRARRAPHPATCRVSDGVDDASGWPTECGCTDPFHGS